MPSFYTTAGDVPLLFLYIYDTMQTQTKLFCIKYNITITNDGHRLSFLQATTSSDKMLEDKQRHTTSRRDRKDNQHQPHPCQYQYMERSHFFTLVHF